MTPRSLPHPPRQSQAYTVRHIRKGLTLLDHALNNETQTAVLMGGGSWLFCSGVRLRYFTLTRRKNEAGASSGATVALALLGSRLHLAIRSIPYGSRAPHFVRRLCRRRERIWRSGHRREIRIRSAPPRFLSRIRLHHISSWSQLVTRKSKLPPCKKRQPFEAWQVLLVLEHQATRPSQKHIHSPSQSASHLQTE